MPDPAKWREAPNTRPETKRLAVQMNDTWDELMASLDALQGRQYHESDVYGTARDQIRRLEDHLARLKWLLSLQQGLEHKTFVDVIASQVLELGEALTSMEFLSRIEKNDPIRELQRKAGET
jgi:hypothetical protein